MPKRPDVIAKEKWEAEQALIPPDGKDMFYLKVKAVMASLPRTRDEPDEDEMPDMGEDDDDMDMREKHMMMRMGGYHRQSSWMIPGQYFQFNIEVTEELYDEYYAKRESGDIRPESSKVWKHRWNGGPYNGVR